MRVRNRLPVAALSCLLAVAAACSKDSPTAPSSAVYPKSITIGARGGVAMLTNVALANPTDTVVLSATATMSDGTVRDVTSTVGWQSSDRAVVTVSTGTVTAVGYGVTSVRAYAGAANASVAVRVAPEGAFVLNGTVTEQGGFTVSDAAVQAASAVRTFTATTRDTGSFSIPAFAGDVTVTVQKAGYEVRATRLAVERDQSLDVQLHRSDNTGLAGVYTMTITAAASCTLPADAARRSYLARIIDRGAGSLYVQLGGPQAYAVLDGPGFPGAQSGSTVQFDVDDSGGYPSDYPLAAVIGPGTFVCYWGIAHATIGRTSGIVATLDGTIEFRQNLGGGQQTRTPCTAADHRVEFVRSGS